MYLHRRQFIIGPIKVDHIPNWRNVELPGIGYLSHCPELSVCSVKTENGEVWHLIGLAVQTDNNRQMPSAELRKGNE